MDRKSTIKALQKYNQYKGKSDYYISKELTNTNYASVDVLQKELKKLKTKKLTIKIKDREYTEEYIYNAIQFYEQHKTQLTLTNNTDTDTLILLNLNDQDLYHACQINKYIYTLCYKNKILKERFNKIKDIVNHPIEPKELLDDFQHDADDYISTIDDLIKYKDNLIERFQSVAYQSKKDFILNMDNRYHIQSFSEKIIIKGPVKLTEGQILYEIASHLPDVDFYDYFGGYYFFEGIEKYKGEYYLALGS